MINERQEELAALYALGLLEGAERTAFEAEMARHPELAALVRSLADASSQLALAAPPATPPHDLKARMLASVEAAEPTAIPPLPFLRLVPWGIAAGLLLTTAWLASHNLALRGENEALQNQRDLVEIAYRAAQNQLSERSIIAEHLINDLGAKLRRSEDLARLKVAALASLAGNTKEAQAIAVWDPEKQAGLLTFDKMPWIPDWQDYQIWVVDPAYPDPVNGGVFRVDMDGRAVLAFKPDQPVSKAAAFAVSLEKKGGVPKAEGPIVLMGKLPPGI